MLSHIISYFETLICYISSKKVKAVTIFVREKERLMQIYIVFICIMTCSSQRSKAQ